jgi:cell division protein FtsW
MERLNTFMQALRDPFSEEVVFGAGYQLAQALIGFGRALWIGRRNELSGRLFAAYLAYGIAFLFLGQVLINMAVNTGLLPTKGLTLPFLSYGGSSLLLCLVMTALLLRIDIEHYQLQLPRMGARPL